ncbi:MAG TPA: branched-chain amino acid ABC transporter permease [Kiloniellaceae bacterium]|nr:branched-chain amino acid ABC transporter permease [Kiloniellaceae bacterium]
MLVFFAVLAAYPLWSGPVGLYDYLGVEIMIWIIYALGYNLLLGYTGLPSFGHGAYFGIGAYAYGLTLTAAGGNLVLGLALAILLGAAAAGCVGLFLSHRRGIYFALMTIAFGQVAWFIAIKWHSVTGGEDGLLDITRPSMEIFGTALGLQSNAALFYFVFALLVVVVVGLWRLVNTPYGLALQAIRMNETRARFVGYRVWGLKWSVFALSGAIAGLAGGLLAIAQESAYPDVMSLHASGFVVMIVLIGGGFVSFWGPVFGAIIFFGARDILGAATETWLLWYGLLFMAIMIFEPKGVVGAWRRILRTLDRRARPQAARGEELS